MGPAVWLCFCVFDTDEIDKSNHGFKLRKINKKLRFYKTKKKT